MHDYYNYTIFIGFVVVLTMFFGYIRETKKYDIRFPEMSYEKENKI